MSVAVKAPPRIVLSHAGVDAGLADLVSNALRSSGVAVEDFQSELLSGKTWADIIRDRLQASDGLVVLLTQSSMRSQWALYEAGAAMALNRPIYVVDDGIPPHEFPATFQQYQCVPAANLRELVRHLQAA